MRFGIGCEREHTLEEIGKEFDVLLLDRQAKLWHLSFKGAWPWSA
jgi:hypothetical protein